MDKTFPKEMDGRDNCGLEKEYLLLGQKERERDFFTQSQKFVLFQWAHKGSISAKISEADQLGYN